MSTAARNDSPLKRFYGEPNPERARELLASVLETDVEQLVRAIVNRRLRSSGRLSAIGGQLEEQVSFVAAEAVLAVAKRLLAVREGEAELLDIHEFSGRTANRACDAFYMRSLPVRYGVAQRVRTHLRCDDLFREWLPSSGVPHGMLRGWATPPPEAREARLSLLLRDAPNAVAEIFSAFPDSDPSRSGAEDRPDTHRCIWSGLRWAEGALTVDVLIGIVQAARNEYDVATAQVGTPPEDLLRESIGSRDLLANVWKLIPNLSHRQSAALLLNFRHEDQSLLEMLFNLEIATPEQIAALLKFEPARFRREIMPSLPWPDKRVSVWLGCTEEQVGNLRSSARRIIASRLSELGLIQDGYLRFSLPEVGREDAVGTDEQIRSALATSELEPCISTEMLIEHVRGKGTDVDRELIDSMLKIDDRLGEAVSEIGKALAEIDAHPRSPSPKGNPILEAVRETFRKPGSRILTECVLAVALAIGLTVVLPGLQSGPQIDQLHSQLAKARSSERAALAELDQTRRERDAYAGRVPAIENSLKVLDSDARQMRADLGNAIRSHPEPGSLGKTLEPKTVRDGTSEYLVVGDKVAKVIGPKDPIYEALQGKLEVDPSIAAMGAPVPVAGMSGPGDLSPSTTAIASLTPTLRWKADPGIDQYRASVSGSGLKWSSPWIKASEIPVPSGLLRPGQTYRWFVEENRKSGQIGPATIRSATVTFVTLSRIQLVQATRIARDRESGPLVRGVEFARLGLLNEAELEFRLLERADPDLGHKLVSDVSRLATRR